MCFSLRPGRCSWPYPALLSNALLFDDGLGVIVSKRISSLLSRGDGSPLLTSLEPGVSGTLFTGDTSGHLWGGAQVWRAWHLNRGDPSPTFCSHTYTLSLTLTHVHVHTHTHAHTCTCPHAHTCTHVHTYTHALGHHLQAGPLQTGGSRQAGKLFPRPQPQLRHAPAHPAPLGWWSSPACALCGFTFELPAPPHISAAILRGVSGGLCPLCNRGPRSTVSSGSYNEEGTPWAPQGL